MRTWARAHRDQRCGKLGCQIHRGDPILAITLHAGTFVRVRCAQCADESVPADLPPLLERQLPSLRPLVRIATGPGLLPLDWKRTASGREPGEEG